MPKIIAQKASFGSESGKNIPEEIKEGILVPKSSEKRERKVRKKSPEDTTALEIPEGILVESPQEKKESKKRGGAKESAEDKTALEIDEARREEIYQMLEEIENKGESTTPEEPVEENTEQVGESNKIGESSETVENKTSEEVKEPPKGFFGRITDEFKEMGEIFSDLKKIGDKSRAKIGEKNKILSKIFGQGITEEEDKEDKNRHILKRIIKSPIEWPIKTIIKFESVVLGAVLVGGKSIKKMGWSIFTKKEEEADAIIDKTIQELLEDESQKSAPEALPATEKEITEAKEKGKHIDDSKEAGEWTKNKEGVFEFTKKEKETKKPPA